MNILRGKIISGIGDFSKKMESIPGLLNAYQKKLGIKLFPGTLNIVLPEEYHIPQTALWLDKSEYGGTVSIHIVPCKIKDRKAFILRTENNELGRGHHPKTIIEIATDVRIRDTYDLSDGDELEVVIQD